MASIPLSVARLAEASLPVQRSTLATLLRLRRNADHVDAHALAAIVMRDPAMCLYVLGEVARRSSRLATQAETVTGALLLGGIEPFFASLDGLACVEDVLAHQLRALAGVRAVIDRSWSAARLASAFAIHRQDEDVELLQLAALLGSSLEMLAWCEAPDAMLEIAKRQRLDPQLRTAQAQQDVLGFELAHVQAEVLQRRGLAESLRSLLDPAQGAHPGERCVLLALRIARHLEGGWHNGALPDDFESAGRLLNIAPHAAARMVRQVLG